VKNTGPGGTYLGWISPEGKFFYHRKRYPTAIEETLGKALTAKDGFNGILRSVKNSMKPNADKEFLQKCLTPSERKHILPANKFHFAVVSARRATIEQGIQDILTVEAQFRNCGVKPMWYVDAESLQAYKDLGLNAKVGGKLTPARNMALADAARLGKRCVQCSDDISKWEYLDIAKQNLSGEVSFDKANAALAGCPRWVISPLASAQFILAKMRSDPKKPQLGGVFPTGNATMTMGFQEYSRHHFILGDWFVADNSPCRFDNTLTLKEDYDYTCSHIKKHGAVLRCNRMFVIAKHATNKGGAVAVRDNAGTREQFNISILMAKWPGVFKHNVKRKNEVLMCWKVADDKTTRTSPRTEGKKNAASRGLVKKTIEKTGKTTVTTKKPAAVAGLKSKLQKLAKVSSTFPNDAVLHYTGNTDGSDSTQAFSA